MNRVMHTAASFAVAVAVAMSVAHAYRICTDATGSARHRAGRDAGGAAPVRVDSVSAPAPKVSAPAPKVSAPAPKAAAQTVKKAAAQTVKKATAQTVKKVPAQTVKKASATAVPAASRQAPVSKTAQSPAQSSAVSKKSIPVEKIDSGRKTRTPEKPAPWSGQRAAAGVIPPLGVFFDTVAAGDRLQITEYRDGRPFATTFKSAKK